MTTFNALMSTMVTIMFGTICILIYNYVNLIKRVKELEGKKPKVFTLKQIPRKPSLKDIDPSNKILLDILESVKLEEWSYEVKEEPSYGSDGSYTVTWNNPSNTINMRARLRTTKNSSTEKYEPYLGGFYVSTQDGSLSFSDTDDEFKNKIIVFIWDYIIKYHESQNSSIKKSYIDAISAISSKLTTLNRNKKLNEIL